MQAIRAGQEGGNQSDEAGSLNNNGFVRTLNR